MNVDKTTRPSWMSIVIEQNTAYFDELKKRADNNGQNDELSLKESGGIEHLEITLDDHAFNADEIYYDEEKNEFVVSGTLTSATGNTYFSIALPLSNTVLIDILHHSIKKLNKLKTALEALK